MAHSARAPDAAPAIPAPSASETRRLGILRRVALYSAISVAAMAFGMLCLWLSLGEGSQGGLQPLFAMKVNAAATLLMLATALGLRWLDHQRWRIGIGVLASLAAALSLLTLAEYLAGVDLGIDQVLVEDPFAARSPGRIAPGSVVCFFLISLALAWVESRRSAVFIQGLLLVAAGPPLASLGGYLYHAPDWPLISGMNFLSLDTAVCQLLLILGASLVRPRWGLVPLLVSDSLAGSIVRMLLPTAFVLPVAVGGMVLAAEHAGAISTTLGSALLVCACALIFAAAVWLTATVLWRSESVRADAERQRDLAENQARAGEQRLRIAVETAKLGTWELDLASGEMQASVRCKANFGLPPDAVFPYGYLAEVIDPADRPRMQAAVQTALNTSADYYAEYAITWPDGSRHYIVASGRALRDHQGTAVRMVGVTLDVTARKLAEAALADADRRKDEFLATLAHELRNPLAPIRQAAKIARYPNVTAAQLRWGLDVIDRQTSHMALLLDDLLDVSRITRGHLQLRKESVDLEAVVDTAVETARPLIQLKRHSLSVDLPDSTVHMNVDPLRLAQVLSNLLTNAAKYSTEGAHIALSVSVAEGDALIRVKDTGIGLEPQMLHRVFDMFSQVEQALGRSEGGLGIGLALVKGLVELHGGTITAFSEGLGRGSEFVVRLPNVITAGVSMEDSVARTNNFARGRRILIADDNRDAADSLRALLELQGHMVTAVHDGEQAITSAAEIRPEVLLLDIGMPRLNGYEVAQRIRSESWGRRLTLVAITGWGQVDDRARALSCGFDYHLTKPVDLDALNEVLSSTAPSASGAMGLDA